MAKGLGRSFAEQAFRDGVPTAVLLQKCRNWGISRERAVILAEDAVAEAHRRLLDRLFESDAHYQAWLTRTAIHVAIDILRRERRRRDVPLIEEPVASTPSLESDSTIVAECLAKLTAEERAILQMTFEEGCTLDEIAARVLPSEDGSANARRLRVKRKRDLALQRLRSYLIKLRI